MAQRARTTRERMLDAAETLLRERGLAGAGIQQVVARSGAPIGSVYHFFPRGKTQLVAEALQIHGEKARALFVRILEDRSKPLPERFRTWFQTAAAGFDRAGANKGCAIGTVALDLDARHEALRTVCRDAFDGWIDSIARELPWTDGAARRSFAEMVVASLEGAFILSRARQSGAPFITVGEWLAAILERGKA
jgi:AcrR family transcriptional regulator